MFHLYINFDFFKLEWRKTKKEQSFICFTDSPRKQDVLKPVILCCELGVKPLQARPCRLSKPSVSVKWSQLTVLPKPTNFISHSCKVSAIYLPFSQYLPLIINTCSIYVKPSQIITRDKFSLPVNQMPNVSRSDPVATLYKWYSFLWIDSVNWQCKHFCLFLMRDGSRLWKGRECQVITRYQNNFG